MKPVMPAIAFCIVTIAQPASATVEDCMVDTWIADMRDVADMMALQMQGTATPVRGEIAMQIADDGSFTLLADDMIINVQVPNVPAMDVKVVGYSAGQLDAADNVFLASVSDYNLVGSADVLGQTMEIPFSSETGMGGGGTGWFECAGDTLRFEATVDGVTNANRMPRLWRRR
ncbi:hypothetical protein [Roseobacter sp. CCS2]|uniref:hypothetical protein n=1 Tax=Roseobacter sp. CCS2 TaxID=391593 RepID=UPI0000F3E004|nr:hypothetical protein [Roseobacter sp. CCS2]EBA11947.1 hypothetical protein RCCS2_11659 [Roseobacter sp. CCS2]